MDQPKIPTLKDSQKPQVKVRGLEAGMTLFDRLKQFKKKDLAFILAGLGTLFMAPLAEHFMMSPEGGDSALNAGFGGKGGGKGIFDGNGSVNPYETGINGQAPGNAVGGGSDVITPLNVRDPSALVMGPGATQQPPTSSVAPATPPPTAPVAHTDSDLKDALAASARGVGAAAKAAAKTLLPVPKVALSGAGGLRGLGVASGASSAVASPISSAGLVSGKANAGGGGLNNVRANSNYKGVARGQSQGGDGLDALKKAAANAGDVMNRGSAATALDQAAAQQIPNGGSGIGGAGEGGAGPGDKGEGGNQDKNSKNTGESLEFLKQKAMQEAKIALWAKEQEAGDNKLEMLKIRNSMAEAIAGKIGGAIGDTVSCPLTPGKNFKKCMTPSVDNGSWYCDGATTSIDGGTVGNCSSDGIAYTSIFTGPNTYTLRACAAKKDPAGGVPAGDQLNCHPMDGANPNNKDGGGGNGGPDKGSGGFAGMASEPNVANLNDICVKAKASKEAAAGPKNGATAQTSEGINNFLDNITLAAKNLVEARNAMFSGSENKDCGAGNEIVPKNANGLAIKSAVDAASRARDLLAVKADKGPAIDQMKGVVGQRTEELKVVPGAAELKLSENYRKAAVDILNDSLAKVQDTNPPAPPAEWKDNATSLAAANKFIAQINAAKTALAGDKGALDLIVADDKGSLTVQQTKQLDPMAVAGEKNSDPTIKRVVSANVALAKAEDDFKKAGGIDNGSTAVDKDGKIKPADAEKGHSAPGSDLNGTLAAVTKAEQTVGVGTKEPSGVVKAVQDFKTANDLAQKTPGDEALAADAKTKKEAAMTAIQNAERDVQEMQTAQSGALDGVATTLKAIEMPKPATN